MSIKEFLLAGEVSSNVEKEVIISDRFVDENGKPIPFKIRSITRLELTELTNQAERTNKALDYLLVEKCCIEPNFKDVELQDRYGVKDGYYLIDKILLAGEVNQITTQILGISKLGKSFDEALEEAKKL